MKNSIKLCLFSIVFILSMCVTIFVKNNKNSMNNILFENVEALGYGEVGIYCIKGGNYKCGGEASYHVYM